MILIILQRIWRKHWLKLLFPVIIFLLVYYFWIYPPKYQGYQPDQPIAFSHKIHAGQFQMDCQFCHATVERSAQASIPDMATCMRCHQEVASDSSDIQYLRSLYERGQPIAWVKVHDLPDHARFSHQVHVNKGVECSQCHGAVEQMDKVRVTNAFNMGWCVNCHRDYSANVLKEEVGYNKIYPLTECSTCHY